MERVKELDGLRAAAILSVIAWHYLGGTDSQTVQWHIFVVGRAGVDLFFVLSGYLITGILLQNRTSPRYFSTFYGRRAYRILPVYGVVVAIYLVCINMKDSSRLLFDGTVPWWSYVLGLQNFWMAANQNYGATWLAGTWSLAIEEQFYLLFPLIVYLVPLPVLSRLLIAILFFCPIARIIAHAFGDNLGYYVLMPLRADNLAIGALIALLKATGEISSHVRRLARVALWASVCFFPVAAFLIGGDPNFHMPFWGHTYLVILFGSIVFGVLQAQGSPRLAFLRGSVSAFFARISYSLYLAHTNVLLLTLLAFGYPRNAYAPTGAGLTALAFAISILICTASYRFFEAPLLQLAHRRFTFSALAPPIIRAPAYYLPTAAAALAILAAAVVQNHVSRNEIVPILSKPLQSIKNKGDILLTQISPVRWSVDMRDSIAFCAPLDTSCIKGVFNDPARGRIFVQIERGVVEYPSLSVLLTPDKLMTEFHGFELYGPLGAIDVLSVEANLILSKSLQPIKNTGDVLLTELPFVRWSPEMRDAIVPCAPSDISCIKEVFNATAQRRIFVLIRRGVLEYPPLSALLTADKLMTALENFELYGPFQATDVASIEVNSLLTKSLQPIKNRGDVLLTGLPSVRWSPEMRDSVGFCSPSDTSCIEDVFNDPARGRIFVLTQRGAPEYLSLALLLTPEKLMAQSGAFELYGPLHAADLPPSQK
jgi:peptidoglycan/LPS O-acetylase OafA/YrhL